MARKDHLRHRLERSRAPTVSSSEQVSPERHDTVPEAEAVVECGWGRLIFGQTFTSPRALADALLAEHPGHRDIALYLRDPHVVISMAPQQLFLDPSHTFRLWLDRYQAARRRPMGFAVRLLNSTKDAEAIHDLYQQRHMVPPEPEFVWEQRASRILTYLVATDEVSGKVIGTVTGIDHLEAFNDPEKGSSLWALAVDPQAAHPGIGEALVRHLAEYFKARGRHFMDLSVLHDNEQAIQLYEKLGFERVPVFALKHKNPYNEPLFVGETGEDDLNPYARIIVREAKRRGIHVDILDAEAGYFELSFGGRTIVCRESLSELTTAVAMSRCDNKAVTHRILHGAGLKVPDQERVESDEDALSFLDQHGSVVVKPARGEQGAGISVDVSDESALLSAIGEARQVCDEVLVEEFVEGEDLRVIVIDDQVVAAATRRPPAIVGTGMDSIEELIQKQSRRREAATDGESKIPLDRETERCVEEAGYGFGDVLPQGHTLPVRRTANLHTGGTIHDVTPKLHPKLRLAAVKAARALNIPVTGLDFIVPDTGSSDYVIIEANERPGLANHEPQPTAERFIDLLFPQTIPRSAST